MIYEYDVDDIYVRPSVVMRCQSAVNTFDQATSTLPWDFTVNVGVMWTCKWPRPKHSDLDTLCNFSVVDGKLELAELIVLAGQLPGGTASAWLCILQPHLEDTGSGPSVKLVSFLTLFPRIRY
jgi:hypothetical protein